MKKFLPWLLLLLLLIIICVWSKIEDIHTKTPLAPQQETIVQKVSPKKQYMEYTITQTENGAILNGTLSNKKQQNLLSSAYQNNSSQLTIDNISLHSELLGDKAVSLTGEILPHFIKHYKNGKIVYSDNMLYIYGEVKSYEAQHTMQSLLATSTLPTQNHTKVVIEKPIYFTIIKSPSEIALSGTFNTQAQAELLRKKLPASTKAHIDQERHLVDNGIISFTQNILPVFVQYYTKGTIEYSNEVLHVSGTVTSQKALERMQSLLSSDTINIVNRTTLDQEAIAKAAAQAEALRKAQEEAKLAAEMEAKRAAEEARRQEERRQEEEKRTKAQAIQKEKELKEKIKKLLQIENIEFEVASDRLTAQGKATVEKLSAILLQYPHFKAEIAGHTDSDGSALFNKNLSQKRVDTVKSLLIKKGIDSGRLTAIGYGESKPLVPNTSDENKQKNRRVEIHIQGE